MTWNPKNLPNCLLNHFIPSLHPSPLCLAWDSQAEQDSSALRAEIKAAHTWPTLAQFVAASNGRQLMKGIIQMVYLYLVLLCFTGLPMRFLHTMIYYRHVCKNLAENRRPACFFLRTTADENMSWSCFLTQNLYKPQTISFKEKKTDPIRFRRPSDLEYAELHVPNMK